MGNINFQYEPLPVPNNWDDSERKLVTRLTDLFDIIFAWKGRLRVEDLAKSTAMTLITSASFVSSQVRDLQTTINGYIGNSALPNFTAGVLNALKTGQFTLTELTNLKAALDAAYAAVGHTHIAATTGADGLMSAADKVKLDRVASGNTLFDGNWSTGTITVPNIQNYKLLAVWLGTAQSDNIVAVCAKAGTVIKGTASHVTTSFLTYNVQLSAGGDVLTLVNCVASNALSTTVPILKIVGLM